MVCKLFFEGYYPQGCEGTGDACEVCVPIFARYSWLIVLIVGLLLMLVHILYLRKYNKSAKPTQEETQ